MSRSLRFSEKRLNLYELRAWVVMPNHVHILICPRVELRQITRTVKTFTAREANSILQRTGQPFWQDESYDHWVRSRDEMEATVRYIESNPVAAGLATAVQGWPWSSAASSDRPEACPTLRQAGGLSHGTVQYSLEPAGWAVAPSGEESPVSTGQRAG